MKEAMKQVQSKLYSMQMCHPNAVLTLALEAEEILEAALAKQELGEPVAWGDVKVRPDGKRYCRAVATTNQSNLGYSPLYTTPQQEQGKPDFKAIAETCKRLAQNELNKLAQENFGQMPRNDVWADKVLLVRDSFETAHGIKE